MTKVTALIPAFNPSEQLAALVRELAADFAAVIVVNDGSSDDCDHIFKELETIRKVSVLRHAINLGKGAALKTGLNHAYCYHSDHLGVVTIDADGQHRVMDAVAIADILKRNRECLILGARTFGKEVPFRSRIGNTVTRHLFRILIGQKLSDTQSGLRGIPRSFIPGLLRINASGYEFELDMLLACKYAGRKIVEQPIATVYLDGNRSSHFNPVIDSMKIYFQLFRFTLASLSSAAIDYAIFLAVYGFSADLLLSQASGRAVSMLFNYSAVKRVVFYSDQHHSHTFPKYLSLVVISGSVSYLLIKMVITFLPVSVVIAKAGAESIIFFANFAVQREFIFTGKRGLEHSRTSG
jgi:glycosyltransferase involved in cell wall biosynthesis